MARAKTKARTKSARKGQPKTAARTRKKARAKEGDWRITCTSLAQIRQNIDRLDALIVPLLCERRYFVTQAAQFKPSVAGVVVQSRVEEIVSTVRALAKKLKSDPDTIETVYRAIIDAFTADEQRHWRKLNRPA